MKHIKYLLFTLFLTSTLLLNAQENDCDKFMEYFENEEYDKAISSLHNCKTRSNLSDNELLIIDYYLQLSYFYSGDSVNYNSDSLEKCIINDSFKNTEYAFTGYIILSLDNLSKLNYNKAIDYASEVVGIAKLNYGEMHSIYVRTLSFLAKCHLESDDYEEAIEINEQALNILKMLPAEDNYQTSIEVLVSLSDCYSQVGDYQKSIDNQEELLKIIKLTSGENNSDYVEVLSELAKNYGELGEYILSIEREGEAISIRQQIYGKNHLEYALGLTKLADYYMHLGKYEDSIELGKQALEVFKGTVGDKHHYYAAVLNLMATNYRNTGKHTEGLIIAEEAVENVKQALGENNLQYAIALGNLARYYSDIGNREKALELTTEVLSIIEETVGNNHLMYYNVLGDLALIYSDLGNYKKAIELHKKELEGQENIIGKNHLSYAISLDNLAGNYRITGDYQKAIDLNNQAGFIIKQVLGEESPHYAHILNGLSNIYSDLGNYEEAVKIAEKAMKIIYESNGIEHSLYSTILHNLADLYSDSGKISEAIELEEFAIDNIIKEYGVDHPGLASNYNNLSKFYWYIDNYQKAVELSEKSLIITKSTFGKNHFHYANSLNNLAVIIAENDINKAIDLKVEALNITENVLGEHHPNYEYILGNLVEDYLLMNSFSQSIEYARKFLNLRRHRLQTQFSWMSEKERTMYVQKVNDEGEFLNLVSAGYASQSYPDFVEMSFDAGLLSKGLLLQSNIELNNLLMESGNHEVIEKANKLRVVHSTLSRLYEKPISERYLNTDSLETEVQQLERELLTISKEYGDYTQFMSVTWQDVQKGLGEKDVAIEFVEFPVFQSDSVMYAALVLRKDWEVPQMIPLFEKREIEQYITQSPDKQYSGFVGKQLYKLMWKPLEKVIEKGDAVHFSAAGIYHQIALEYLSLEDGTPLCDSYNFRRLSSTRQLALEEQQTDFKNATLYGGIQYDVNPSEMLAESNKYQEDESHYAYRGMPVDSLRGGSWVPLDNTVKEVEFISNELTTNKIKTALFTGANANEESIKALSGKKTNILHLATHGFFLPIEETRKVNYYQMIGSDDNPAPDMSMRRSGLIMAGGNRAWTGDTIPEGIDDGVLTAQEISVLDFREMDLVVLSACETGLGDIDTSEGVFGLQRAFKKAGAKTLIMSLWKVNDEVTKSLMNKFYQSLLSGKTKHEAFLEAQQLIRSRHPEPQNWAAFIMLD